MKLNTSETHNRNSDLKFSTDSSETVAEVGGEGKYVAQTVFFFFVLQQKILLVLHCINFIFYT